MRDKDIKETRFEEDLKLYFPDIYKIHEAGKFDKNIWNVFDSMIKMIDSNDYGEIKIIYHRGRINQVETTIITRAEILKPLLTHPNVLE